MAPHAAPHATAETRRCERHRPEDTVLYQSIRDHWPEFLERAEGAGGLPRFVVGEVEEYLRCGLLEHGCVRVGCRSCGFERLVAFSCKRRGFCPSCLGRRMADTAVHLVEEVIPEVPVRQWVCSLPWRLRVLLGYDRRLCAEVLEAFIVELSRSLKRRAKEVLGLDSVDQGLTGAVSVIQRGDSALRLNVHLPRARARRRLRARRGGGRAGLPRPRRANHRGARRRRPEDSAPDPEGPRSPWPGARWHRRVRRGGASGRAARPVRAVRRRSGRDHARRRPRRSAPAPRRRPGARAQGRAQLGGPRRQRPRRRRLPLFENDSSIVAPEPSRKPWAWLLRHVFEVDVTTCPRCGGVTRWLEAATTPDAIARLLAKHGLGPRPPPPRRAPTGQLRLVFSEA